MAEEPENPGFVVIDTESSDLFSKDPLTGKFLPADHPDQAHLASFCAIATHPNLEIQEVHNIPIKPDGWVMSEGATRVNGLTTDWLLANGEPLERAVDLYVNYIAAGRIVIGYNVWFDLKLMRGAMRRAGRSDMLPETKSICMMWAAAGRRQKLAVTCARLGIAYSEMHTALGDAMAALDIARRLAATSRLPAPRTYNVTSNLTGNEQETT